MRKPVAEEFLKLTEIWNETNKEVIADNVKKYLCQKKPECCSSFNKVWDTIVEMTGAKKHTVYAWLNKSRENVKVPLLKLCEIADELDIDIMEFFKNNE